MAFLLSKSRYLSNLNPRWVELGGGEEEVLEKAAVAVDKVRELEMCTYMGKPIPIFCICNRQGRTPVGSPADGYPD